jgi:hypothetical protein
MQVGIVIGLGLAIGITFLSGCAPSAAEVTVPLASAPTPLVPEAYTALSAAVLSTTTPAVQAPLAPTALSAPVGSTASPAAQAPLSPPPAAALSVAGRTDSSSAIKSNQYHPYWVVNIH